jgi:plastocyanin
VRARLVLPSAAALAALLVAAGCGGSGATNAPVQTNDVSMAKSYRFDPATISISAGDTVTWTNDDNFTHTVKVEGQADHKVGRGDSVSIMFPKAGTYRYEYTLHSHDMQGTVIVS